MQKAFNLSYDHCDYNGHSLDIISFWIRIITHRWPHCPMFAFLVIIILFVFFVLFDYSCKVEVFRDTHELYRTKKSKQKHYLTWLHSLQMHIACQSQFVNSHNTNTNQSFSYISHGFSQLLVFNKLYTFYLSYIS